MQISAILKCTCCSMQELSSFFDVYLLFLSHNCDSFHYLLQMASGSTSSILIGKVETEMENKVEHNKQILKKHGVYIPLEFFPYMIESGFINELIKVVDDIDRELHEEINEYFDEMNKKRQHEDNDDDDNNNSEYTTPKPTKK